MYNLLMTNEHETPEGGLTVRIGRGNRLLSKADIDAIVGAFEASALESADRAKRIKSVAQNLSVSQGFVNAVIARHQRQIEERAKRRN